MSNIIRINEAAKKRVWIGSNVVITKGVAMKQFDLVYFQMIVKSWNKSA